MPKIHFPSLYTNDSLCIINSVLLSHNGYTKEPIYRPHFMKIHEIFIKENLHMLFLTHFLVPRQFMLVLKPALQYCEPSYQATTNFVKLSINSELNKTNLVHSGVPG